MKTTNAVIGFLMLLLLSSCGGMITGESNEYDKKDISGKTVQTRYLLNDGYQRTSESENSFGHYLRNLPLKSDGSNVLYYNGDKKTKANVYDAVIDLPIGKKDLHQCADAVMRLRAEYLYRQKRYDEIHFNFTNGFNAEYSKWRKGYRIKVNGNKVTWIKSSQPSDSYQTFWAYLEMVFSYAGTLSLSKEMKQVEVKDMKIGDVFIQGGSPGHAVIVVDMMKNTGDGVRYFMLAQSYMPAQEIQVLLNHDNESVWYVLDTNELFIRTPEWKFSYNHLKRF